MKWDKRSVVSLGVLALVSVLALSRVYRRYTAQDAAPQSAPVAEQTAPAASVPRASASVGASAGEIVLLTLAGAAVVIVSIKKLRAGK